MIIQFFKTLQNTSSDALVKVYMAPLMKGQTLCLKEQFHKNRLFLLSLKLQKFIVKIITLQTVETHNIQWEKINPFKSSVSRKELYLFRGITDFNINNTVLQIYFLISF